METLPQRSINLIVADVPYNIGKDFGNESDKREKSEYVFVLKNWIKLFSYILKDDGTLVIYTGKQYYPYYYLEIE